MIDMFAHFVNIYIYLFVQLNVRCVRVRGHHELAFSMAIQAYLCVGGTQSCLGRLEPPSSRVAFTSRTRCSEGKYPPNVCFGEGL